MPPPVRAHLGRRDLPSARPVSSVAAREVPARQTVRPLRAVGHEPRSLAVQPAHLAHRRPEPQVTAAAQELGHQVGHQVLLRVDGVGLAAAETAVPEGELPAFGAEDAGVVGPAARQQTGAEAVVDEHADRVGRQEARARPPFDVCAAAPLHDQAVDAGRQQQVAEHQPGGSRTDDQYCRPTLGGPFFHLAPHLFDDQGGFKQVAKNR
ncbi:hypothetical protein RKD27_005825 [Streptomyces sp. SAI-126]